MDRTLAQWFAASVARHGDRPALEVAGVRLTYQELDALAEHLAGLLVAAWGGPPSRVGLLTGRDVATYAGYLAIQRLGATVVPLNPEFPTARTAAMVKASEPDLLLAGPEIDAGRAGDLPVVRAPASVPLRGHRKSPPVTADPKAIAYILFTSGSTGRPKGVPIRHRSVSAYLRHVIDRYALGPGCRLSQTFELTFDLSVFDMFAAWGSGSTLVVPSRDDLLTPVRFVRDARLTHWFSVPSVISLAHRSRRLKPGCMPDLKWSLFCGEPLTVQQARAWREAAPGSTVENLYGPTELTISCTQYRLPPDPADWVCGANGTVAIGRPYDHMQHLIVDERGEPATEGELCMRGVQRFPGYLEPSDNESRFVRFDGGRADEPQEPACPNAGLWYRTGDRVAEHRGVLIHLGRLDQQVKVRGHRVELGEIEAALRERPGVLDAVVVPADVEGEVVLDAICTGSERDGRRVAEALREALPSYMLPRTVTFVDALPLNANGKVDRAAAAALLSAANARA